MYLADDGTKFGWDSESTTNPDLVDYRQNGQYCISGLAYNSAENEATCVSTSQVTFNDVVLDNPYKCDPTHP